MTKRNTQQRRHAIIERLNRDGEVTVDMLAGDFHTSEVTIRKDLTALEASGLLLRRYGGAVPMPHDIIATDGRPEEKVSKRKDSIAQTAAALIRDHNRIIIDSGHTTAALLPRLGTKLGLVVMTNSLDIANALRELENEPTLLMTGGTWDARSEAFQGQLAEQVLRAYDFDQLFIGADGLDPNRGTTTFNELYSLSRIMAEVAREVVVMAESSKIGRKIHNLELSWQQVDVLVSDTGMEPDVKHLIEQQNVRVILAEQHPTPNGGYLQPSISKSHT